MSSTNRLNSCKQPGNVNNEEKALKLNSIPMEDNHIFKSKELNNSNNTNNNNNNINNNNNNNNDNNNNNNDNNNNNNNKDNSIALAEISSTIGFGTPELCVSKESSSNDLKDFLIVFNQENIYDIQCLAAICTVHHRIALQQMSNRCFFLPVIKIKKEQSFIKISKDFLNLFPIPKEKIKIQIIDQWRVKQPKTNQFIARYIFKTLIYFNDEPISENKKCCINTNTIRWFNKEDLERILKTSNYFRNDIQLWGLEPFLILNSNDYILNVKDFRETQFEDFLNTDNIIVQEIINTINYDRSDLRTLYNEFLLHCFPSEKMSLSSFRLFTLKLFDHFLLNNLHIEMLFNSFDENSNNALTFQDVIIGFALMEIPNISQHKIFPRFLLELRHQYLFRYYDFDNDGVLNFKEFFFLFYDFYEKLNSILVDKMMIPVWMREDKGRINHINSLLRKYGDNNRCINQSKLEIIMKEFKDNNINLPNMWNILYCLPIDLFSQIRTKEKFCMEKVSNQSYLSFCDQNEIRCQNCNNNRFKLSNQINCLSRNGEMYDIICLEPFSNQLSLSFSVDIPDEDKYLLVSDILNRLQRLAICLFTENTIEISDYLLMNWFFPNENEKFECIRIIAHMMIDIFANEKRVIKIESPSYIFGDIHGNFKDLFAYSQIFWKSSPFFNTGKYLFLGDYVDRGNWGIEVVIFLFCFKILAPNNFYLIRGNHEIRIIQKQFSFFTECTANLSVELWELINKCFDRMPIAAIIDDQIYCAHGGIPASVNTVTQLNDIPILLSDPFEQSIEAWEILWNDPMTGSELSFLSEEERNFLSNSRGFARNFKRATAYLFSEEAVGNFCEKNSIRYIIRGHEVFQEGFRFNFGGKVITVFSSSKYSFLENSSAIIFVSKNKIRVIQFESN